MNSGMADFYQADAHKKFAGYSSAEIAELLHRNKLSYQDTITQYLPGKDLIHKICVIGRCDQLREFQNHFSGSTQDNTLKLAPWQSVIIRVK